MTELSNPRLWMLRGAYLLVSVGLMIFVWPTILSHSADWPHMNGVVASMLGAVSLLAIVGLRHPLLMLPVLLFEVLWKSIWMIAVALPLWRAGALDAAHMETVKDIVPTIILIVAIPWRYVWATYVRGPAREAAARGAELRT